MSRTPSTPDPPPKIAISAAPPGAPHCMCDAPRVVPHRAFTLILPLILTRPVSHRESLFLAGGSGGAGWGSSSSCSLPPPPPSPHLVFYLCLNIMFLLKPLSFPCHCFLSAPPPPSLHPSPPPSPPSSPVSPSPCLSLLRLTGLCLYVVCSFRPTPCIAG